MFFKLNANVFKFFKSSHGNYGLVDVWLGLGNKEGKIFVMVKKKKKILSSVSGHKLLPPT